MSEWVSESVDYFSCCCRVSFKPEQKLYSKMSVTTRSVTRCWSKSSQNVSKSCPKKVATAVYTLKWMFPKQPKQSTHNWATFVTKNVTQNIQNCPIRSHWSQVKQKQKKNNNTFEKLLRLIWSYEFSRETSTNDVLFLHFCQHQEIGKRKKIKKSFGYFFRNKIRWPK